MGRINRVVSSGEATARLIFISYAVRWFIFMPRRERNESNLFSLIERRSFSSSSELDVSPATPDIRMHYESWKITVCMITTRRLGLVKGETRETTMASRSVGVELARRPPPRDSYTNTPNIRCIHSFRLSSRNSCTCSARWESDRRNSAGCSFRFPFPSLPSPSLSRSIWEYGRARASRQNPENSCYVFSGENNPWLVTNLSLRPGALSRQRYIGCSSSESRRDTHVDYSRLPCEFVFFHKRAPYECQGYSCLTRQPNCSATNVKVLKMIFRENNRERYTRAEYLTFREPIGDFYCYGIWNIFSSSIKYRYPSLRVTQ